MEQDKVGYSDFDELRKETPTLDEHIAELLKQPMGEFKPHAYLCEHSSEVEIYWENTADYSEWLNQDVSIMRERDTEKIVGCRAHVEVTPAFVGNWILLRNARRANQDAFPPEMLAWAQQRDGRG